MPDEACFTVDPDIESCSKDCNCTISREGMKMRYVITEEVLYMIRSASVWLVKDSLKF